MENLAQASQSTPVRIERIRVDKNALGRAFTEPFLASADARQITGQALAIDAGWVIHSPIPVGQPETPAQSSVLR